MADNLPDYASLKPPDDVPPEDYSCHERRADMLRLVVAAGTPGKIVQSDLAGRYDVHDSTISRDMDRLRESINEALGRDAALTSKSIFERVTQDLLNENDWRAKKAAFDAVMDWNKWLQDIGEQERAPQKSEVDVRSRRSEISYQVVRSEDGDEDVTPAPDLDDVDGTEIGFSSVPGSGGDDLDE
jgi:hypothetical protein